MYLQGELMGTGEFHVVSMATVLQTVTVDLIFCTTLLTFTCFSWIPIRSTRGLLQFLLLCCRFFPSCRLLCFRGKNRSDRCCRLMLFFLSLFLSLIGMTQAAAVISTVIVGRHQRAWITPARPWQSQQVGALPASLALTWLWKPSDIQKGTDLHWMHHWINTADYQLTYTVLCRQRRNRERGGKKHMPV